MQWKLEQKKLPLKFLWKIARASTNTKDIYFVTLSDGSISGQGEAAFLTKEEKLIHPQEDFDKFVQDIDTSMSLDEFDDLVTTSSMPLPLKFAFNSAFTHFLAQKNSMNVCELLDQACVKSRTIATSFSIPIMESAEVSEYFNQYDLGRFQALKLKVCRESAFENVTELAKIYQGQIRLDGNESWKDPEELLRFFESISHFKDRIQFIEQPLQSGLDDELLYLKQNSSFKLMADESVSDGNVTEYHQKRFDAVNIKLMKTGSYLKAIKQKQQAKSLGMQVMLGCMVESSLGIWSALQVGHNVDFYDLDGFLFFEEDPHDLVYELNGEIHLR